VIIHNKCKLQSLAVRQHEVEVQVRIAVTLQRLLSVHTRFNCHRTSFVPHFVFIICFLNTKQFMVA
jgi:hypothetical protein